MYLGGGVGRCVRGGWWGGVRYVGVGGRDVGGR